VSAPARAPAAAVEPGREPESVRGWSVQVGSFASRENADRLKSELQRLGFQSFVTEGKGGARKLYRVRVGPESERASAQKLAERLQAARHPGTIVPHP
jgi:DedD protein